MSDFLHGRTIKAPADRVLEAISTLEGIKGWWTIDSAVEPVVGGRARFGFSGGKYILRRRVEQLIPGQRVAWTCLGDDEEWTPGWRRF